MFSFKKPIKRTLRKKATDGDSDEDDSSVSLPPSQVPTDSAENNSKIITIDAAPTPTSAVGAPKKLPSHASSAGRLDDDVMLVTVTATSKLSFGDDEGDTEEFRIKKSSRSRRLASKFKEGLKDNNSKEAPTEEDLKTRYGIAEPRERPKEHSQPAPDASDIVYDDDEETSSTFRTTSKFLNGNIPDKKLIEEMKKRREAARKADEEEYIPLDDTDRLMDSKSRLIREDENDLSDEDEELVMTKQSIKALSSNKEKEAATRRRNREFFELDEMIGHVTDDSDDETHRWEEAQIRKGVSIPQIQAFSDELNRPVAPPTDYGGYIYDPYYVASVVEEIPAPTTNTVEDIRKKIRNRMEIAKDLQRRHFADADKLNTEVSSCQEAVRSLELELKSASFEYKFYQEMRGFVMDVIDCYNAKLPHIVAAENELLGAWQKGATAARELRQQFVKDQDHEIHCKHSVVESVTNQDATVKRRLRLKDHTDRRKAIALAAGKEEKNLDLDEFEPLAPSTFAVTKVAKLFEDTAPDFQSLPALLARFRQWRTSCSDSYSDAYIALCLPKLVAPLIRYQLLGWNPLTKDATALNDMSWLREVVLTMSVTSTSNTSISSTDPDLLVPSLVMEDVVLSKTTALLETWDPFSTLQTVRLVTFLRDCFSLLPTSEDLRKPVKGLIQTLVRLIRTAIDDEVFTPLYSQRILDVDADATNFIAQQFNSALKLFGNILKFYGILSNAALADLAVHRLLDSYLLTSIRTSHDRSESIRRCIKVADFIPDDLLRHGSVTSSTVPKHFDAFCRAMLNLGQTNSNRDEVVRLKETLFRLKDFKSVEILEKQLLNLRSP